MEKIGTFVLDNWYLFLALIVVLALLFVNLAKARLLGFKEIKPVDAVQLINHDDAVLIDVRGDEDHASGHILNAINVPLAMLEDRMKDLQQYRERKVIVYCDSGRPSAHASASLKNNGFESVYKLSGGLTAWKNAGLPVERG